MPRSRTSKPQFSVYRNWDFCLIASVNLRQLQYHVSRILHQKKPLIWLLLQRSVIISIIELGEISEVTVGSQRHRACTEFPWLAGVREGPVWLDEKPGERVLYLYTATSKWETWILIFFCCFPFLFFAFHQSSLPLMIMSCSFKHTATLTIYYQTSPTPYSFGLL